MKFSRGLALLSLFSAATSAFAGGDLVAPLYPVNHVHTMPNWYLNAFVGGNQQQRLVDPFDTVVTFKTKLDTGAAVGLRYGPARAEVQYTYIDTPVRNITSGVTGESFSSLGAEIDARQKASVGMFNLYLDVQPCSMLGLYAGGGVGYAKIQQRSYGSAVLSDDSILIWQVNDTQNKLAYQGMLGVTINTDNQFYIDLGYRHLTTRKLDGYNMRPTIHLLNVGLTYHIPA